MSQRSPSGRGATSLLADPTPSAPDQLLQRLGAHGLLPQGRDHQSTGVVSGSVAMTIRV